MSGASSTKRTIPIEMTEHCKRCPPLIVRLPKGINDNPEHPFKFQVLRYPQALKQRVIEGANDYIKLSADNFSAEARASGIDTQFVSYIIFIHISVIIPFL